MAFTGQVARRLPVGAEIGAGGVDFRVWAPRASSVVLQVEDAGARVLDAHVMRPEGDGWHALFVPGAAAGTLYRYRLDGGPPRPDPASRAQPAGPHGPSRVVDPSRYAWTDAGWPGVSLAGQVLYEMHVGTYTRDGTWAAAAAELPELARLGVGVVEMMPVAEFAGRFGWGYDGVDLFAPSHLYGEPDDLRRFVDRAHALGLGVILDVVYNHLGPDGNFLGEFAPHYFTDRHRTDWGPAINFDGPGSDAVREFFLANAGYWIDEFHFDGLRLDAAQDLRDASADHILRAIARRVRERAGPRRSIVVAENEPQDVRLIRAADAGGYGLDGLWNDDFHHAATVALTGRREAYYSDYRGTPQELLSAVKWGYLYQGQRHRWQDKARGTAALDVPPAALVTYLQNHDQVANSLRGARAHVQAAPGRYRALMALFLLGPGTPLLFQGQEFAASSPFLYFADLPEEVASLMRRGRAAFLAQFPSLASADAQAALPDPGAPESFERSKVDLTERERHAEAYALCRDLLRLRREDPALAPSRRDRLDGAVLGETALLVRFFGGASGDRLLLVNLGPDLALEVMPEPLLAPPAGAVWSLAWSSELVRYGGGGPVPLEADGRVVLPGEAAILLTARPAATAP